MPDTKPEFRFDYKKYESKSITVDKLDQVFNAMMDPKAGTIETLKKGIQLIFFFVYLYSRKRLIDEKFDIAKQEYETSRTNQNSTDINRDNLD